MPYSSLAQHNLLTTWPWQTHTNHREGPISSSSQHSTEVVRKEFTRIFNLRGL